MSVAAAIRSRSVAKMGRSWTAAQRAAHARGYTSRRITSGAGHDAKYMADICPTSMIFIPCKDGLSHNELEDAEDKDLIAGGQVLLDAAFEKAMEPE